MVISAIKAEVNRVSLVNGRLTYKRTGLKTTALKTLSISNRQDSKSKSS